MVSFSRQGKLNDGVVSSSKKLQLPNLASGNAQGRREAEQGYWHWSVVLREPEFNLLEISESGVPEPAVWS